MRKNLFSLASILIVSAGFIVSSKIKFDDFGLTGLHNAILDDRNNPIIKHINEKTLIDIPDKFSNSTPLHLLVDKVATQTGDAQTKSISFIKKLVEAQVKRDVQTDSGFTALNKAVFLASDLADYPLEVVSLLLKGCVAINTPTRSRTPLHFAAGSRLQNNRAKDLVEMLMKHCGSSIDYNALDSNNWTALKVAIAADNMEVVALLRPKTSSMSSTSKIIIGAAVLILLIAAGGSYYYFRYYKKSPAVAPESDKSVTSPSASAAEASPALSNNDSVTSNDNKKDN